MNPFEFNSVGRIVFGRGTAAKIGEIALSFGKSALLVHNGGALERVGGLLAASGVRAAPLRQRGEPQVEDVDGGVRVAKENGCDVVIGLGGGSAIDAAKAIAGLLANGGSALDYMEVVGKGMKITRPAAPFIAMPTTAGTGAEATRNAVIGYPAKQFKASIRSEHLFARVALVDPELGVGVPKEVTARSGMDALCQLIESYTSNGAGPMTDALAIRGIPLAARSLRRAYENGGDLEAREGMALAALWSGITLTNAGLGAVHGFAAPLGANFPIPHGTICGVLLPHVMAANVEALRGQSAEHPTLKRYATVGRLMTGREDVDDGVAIDLAIAFAAELVRDLNIPPLGEFGFTPRDIPQMVELAKKASSMRYNPVALADEALREILRSAY